MAFSFKLMTPRFLSLILLMVMLYQSGLAYISPTFKSSAETWQQSTSASKAKNGSFVAISQPTDIDKNRFEDIRQTQDGSFTDLTVETNSSYILLDPPTADVVAICDAFAAAFADAAAIYTRCYLGNSRPLHLCMKCINEYLQFKKSFEDLEKMSDKIVFAGNKRIKNCNEWILNADRVMAIQKTVAFYKSIWEKASCNNCFSGYGWHGNTTYSHVSPQVAIFFEKDNVTKTCFRNYTILMAQLNYTALHDDLKACNICRKSYTDLNAYYLTLMTEYSDKLCMDVVDSMNYTRLVWGSDFNCTTTARQDGITITLTVLLIIIPSLFYVASYIHYARLEERIVTRRH